MKNNTRLIIVILLILLIPLLFKACSSKTKSTAKKENVETKTESIKESESEKETSKETKEETSKETKSESKEETKSEASNVVETKEENTSSTSNNNTQSTTTQNSQLNTNTNSVNANSTSTNQSGSNNRANTNTQNTTTKTQNTQPTTPKKDVITTKTVTDTIPYTVVRRHNIPGANTRVTVGGQNGYKTYDITYTNGAETSRKLIDSKDPINEVIETYVKISDRVVETREVEDKTKPLYNYVNPRPRWFVKEAESGKTFTYYSDKEAYDHYMNSKVVVAWGTMEPEYEEVLIGYDTKLEEVVVSEEVWDWQ